MKWMILFSMLFCQKIWAQQYEFLCFSSKDSLSLKVEDNAALVLWSGQTYWGTWHRDELMKVFISYIGETGRFVIEDGFVIEPQRSYFAKLSWINATATNFKCRLSGVSRN